MKPSHLITPEKPVLVLRISQPEGRSRNGFVWPTSGPVTCPDWKDTTVCGNGLHGWLRGEGDHSAANVELFTNPNSLWLAVLVPAYIELDGKVKFPQGEVVCSGDQLTVTDYLRANGYAGVVIGGTVTAGDRGTATAGDRGTATAGEHGRATAGDHGTATAGFFGTATAGIHGMATAGNQGIATAGDDATATAGYRGTATAGDHGMATAGDRGMATAGYASTATVGNYGTATASDYGTTMAGDHGTATAGHQGTATAGDQGTATAGYYGKATAGHAGTATAGYRGTAKAGNAGTATAGLCGTATAGDDGMILIKHWDGKRHRCVVGYIGEGIDATGQVLQPKTAYKLDDNGQFILAA